VREREEERLFYFQHLKSTYANVVPENTSQVSFRPPFYSCQGCHPEEVSGTFSTRYSAWYDDDYISTTGQKRVYSSNNQGGDNANGGANDDQGGGDDDAAGAQTDDGGTSYYQQNDDYYNYAAATDDVANNDDAAGNAAANDDANNGDHEVNTDDKINYNYKQHDDDFYSLNDDGRRGLRRFDGGVVVPMDSSHSLTARETRGVSGEGGSPNMYIDPSLFFLSNHE